MRVSSARWWRNHKRNTVNNKRHKWVRGGREMVYRTRTRKRVYRTRKRVLTCLCSIYLFDVTMNVWGWEGGGGRRRREEGEGRNEKVEKNMRYKRWESRKKYERECYWTRCYCTNFFVTVRTTRSVTMVSTVTTRSVKNISVVRTRSVNNISTVTTRSVRNISKVRTS